MGLSGCCCLVKYLLILINFLFWAVSIAVFTYIGYQLTDTSYLQVLVKSLDDYYIGLLIFIGVATLILIISFFGCCGALRESPCLLVTFFCFLLIVLVAEIATGVYAVLHKDQLPTIVHDAVKMSVKKEYGVIKSRTEIFDIFQRQFGCCGDTGPYDWKTTQFNNQTELNFQVTSDKKYWKIPISCCRSNVTGQACIDATLIETSQNAVNSSSLYLQGCTDLLIKEADENLLIILAIIAGIIFIQIFALLISLCLCCAVGDREEDYKS